MAVSTQMETRGNDHVGEWLVSFHVCSSSKIWLRLKILYYEGSETETKYDNNTNDKGMDILYNF